MDAVIDAQSALKNASLIVTVGVRGLWRFRLRLWLALRFIRLAAKIAGMGLQVRKEHCDDHPADAARTEA